MKTENTAYSGQMDKKYRFYHVVSHIGEYRIMKELGVKQILISYFYLRKSEELYNTIIADKDMNVIIDSGLFSFAAKTKGAENTEESCRQYSEEYIDFVSKNHKVENIISFFELDFDVIGYDYHTFVKPYQQRLLEITDKIVLIMQKGRTIEDLKEMCTRYVHTISIPFATDVERGYFDYLLICDIAHHYGKRVHMLGCSTPHYLRFAEQSDSSAWIMHSIYGSQTMVVGNELKTFHWSECDKVDKDDYKERKKQSAMAFMELERIVNTTKEEKPMQVLRLF